MNSKAIIDLSTLSNMINCLEYSIKTEYAPNCVKERIRDAHSVSIHKEFCSRKAHRNVISHRKCTLVSFPFTKSTHQSMITMSYVYSVCVFIVRSLGMLWLVCLHCMCYSGMRWGCVHAWHRVGAIYREV